MPERKSKIETVPISVKITASSHAKMMSYLEDQADHGREPSTVTTFVRAAISEYLERHQAGLYEDDADDILSSYTRRL